MGIKPRTPAWEVSAISLSYTPAPECQVMNYKFVYCVVIIIFLLLFLLNEE